MQYCVHSIVSQVLPDLEGIGLKVGSFLVSLVLALRATTVGYRFLVCPEWVTDTLWRCSLHLIVKATPVRVGLSSCPCDLGSCGENDGSAHFRSQYASDRRCDGGRKRGGGRRRWISR